MRDWSLALLVVSLFRVLARALIGACELSKDERRQSGCVLVAMVKPHTKREEDEWFMECYR